MADNLIFGTIDGLVASLQDATGESTFVQVRDRSALETRAIYRTRRATGD